MVLAHDSMEQTWAAKAPELDRQVHGLPGEAAIVAESSRPHPDKRVSPALSDELVILIERAVVKFDDPGFWP